MRSFVTLLAVMLFVTPRAAQVPDSLPPGVTPQMIQRGRLFYEGPGRCASCHGKDLKGVPRAGSDLTDSVWAGGDGSYESIVRQILEGVPEEHSATGTAMPPEGASNLSERQVRAMAAYVWAVSHRSAS
jgi:mono/diheme cytochrome c family protein